MKKWIPNSISSSKHVFEYCIFWDCQREQIADEVKKNVKEAFGKERLAATRIDRPFIHRYISRLRSQTILSKFKSDPAPIDYNIDLIKSVDSRMKDVHIKKITNPCNLAQEGKCNKNAFEHQIIAF